MQNIRVWTVEFILGLGLCVSISFHILRNLIPFYSIIIFVFYFIAILLVFRRGKVFSARKPVAFYYYLFLGWTLYVAVWSFIYLNTTEPLVALPRLFMTTLLVIPLYCVLETEKQFKILILWYALLTVIGGSTLLYQAQFGPVSWFTEGSIRGGLERFSSILGAITIYGVAYIFGLLIILLTNWFSVWIKLIFCFILIVGGVLSLQKIAMLNMFILIAILFFVNNIKTKIKMIVFICLFLLGGYYYIITNPNDMISRYTDSMMLNAFSIDVSETGGITNDGAQIDKKRFFERIYGMIEENNMFVIYNPFQVLAVGVGVVGGGGGMGMEGPQAHNGLWDLVFMGGTGYLVVFLALSYAVQKSLFRIKTHISHILFWANNIFLFNTLGFTVVMFHPITSFLFWASRHCCT